MSAVAMPDLRRKPCQVTMALEPIPRALRARGLHHCATSQTFIASVQAVGINETSDAGRAPVARDTHLTMPGTAESSGPAQLILFKLSSNAAAKLSTEARRIR